MNIYILIAYFINSIISVGLALIKEENSFYLKRFGTCGFFITIEVTVLIRGFKKKLDLSQSNFICIYFFLINYNVTIVPNSVFI